MKSRRINISSGFWQRDIYFLHLQDSSMSTTAAEQGGTEWAHQKTEMSVKHIAYLLMIERCIKKILRYSDMSMNLLYK